MRNLIRICLLCAAMLQAVTVEAQPVTNYVTTIAAGAYHSLFLKNDGSLWAMGYNYYGQLGDGTFSDTNLPEQIVASNVTAISGGAYHTLFLQSDGSLWAVGEDYYGQLGDSNYDDGIFSPEGTDIPEEILTSNVTAIAAGGEFSLFLESDGSLWGMGYNAFGQLGAGTNVSSTDIPMEIVSNNVTAIAAGGEFSLFLKNDGSLWGMGTNAFGQLGDGTTNSAYIPELIVASNVTMIAAGYYHSLFIKDDGSLWAMGGNTYGQLGDGTFSTKVPFGILNPQEIVSSNVTMVAGGGLHSLFIKSNGSLWGMGHNELGQLGVGNYINPNRPEEIIASNVTAIAAGTYHSLLLKSDGSLWDMGDNENGQLGGGVFTLTNRPEKIVSPETDEVGALKVTLSPAAAVKAGVQWQVDGGVFQNSGATATNLPAGSHTMSFKSATDWIAPSNQTVTIKTGITTPVTIVYAAADVTKPKITVTSPKANEKTLDSAFTLTGTAKDNVAVAGVYYLLNGSDWTLASTANGWTNWTADVTLTPGVNILGAEAVDTSGNTANAKVISFDYLVSAPLTVQTNGSGKTSLANGALLQIGAGYSMTATAAKGFKFTGWTGSATTNGATLKFIMQSNLTFVANFADITKPTVTIVSPTSNLRVSNSVFTVTGKASDNVAATNVLYSLNGSGFAPAAMANGWTNWTADVTLIPGTNTISAYSIDSSGNVSATNTVKFVYVLSAPLTVLINGSGTVTPNDNGALLQIGAGYSMTATAAKGFQLTGWTGSTNTASATLKFIMQSNLTFTANFAAKP